MTLIERLRDGPGFDFQAEPGVSTYTDLAKDVPYCMGCRTPADGTLVLAHRNRNAWGIRFGRGIKTHDVLGAFLCSECHSYGDGAEGRRDFNWWELAVHRSISWAIENDHLEVKK